MFIEYLYDVAVGRPCLAMVCGDKHARVVSAVHVLLTHRAPRAPRVPVSYTHLRAHETGAYL
eukprot:3652868-Pyramimonas_sp.AAC.1